MFIELHILQNFAPSNLNRDETGAPKSCQFGDVPRARVSSQALKRAARDYVAEKELLDPATLGKRSLLLEGKFKRFLVDDFGKNTNEAGLVAHVVAVMSGWKKKSEKEESGALQFLGLDILKALADLTAQNWQLFDELLKVSSELRTLTEQNKALKEEVVRLKKEELKDPSLSSHLDKKKSEKEKLEKRIQKLNADIEKKIPDIAKADLGNKDGKKITFKDEVERIVGEKRTPDIAMFGRMMADAPKFAIDAASQVAHAISTHAVASGEFDYFTAVDELKKELNPEADAGAAHIGTVDFNSACYYRYANIDTNCLQDNLRNAENPEGLAKETVKAFLQSFVVAVPSGKQNSFASPTLPMFVLGVVREGYFCSLANAFSTPAQLQDGDAFGIVEKSIQKMTEHFFNLERMYGETIGTRYAAFCSESRDKFVVNPDGAGQIIEQANSLNDLVGKLTEAAFADSQP